MIRSIVDEATSFRGSFPSKFFFEHFLYFDITFLVGAVFAHFVLFFFFSFVFFYFSSVDTFMPHVLIRFVNIDLSTLPIDVARYIFKSMISPIFIFKLLVFVESRK